MSQKWRVLRIVLFCSDVRVIWALVHEIAVIFSNYWITPFFSLPLWRISQRSIPDKLFLTAKKIAVNILLLYFTQLFHGMNNKVIALLVVCIAVVAAAGCMGLPTGSSTSLQDTSANGNSIRYPSDANMAYTGSPATMPVPTQALSLSGSGTSIIETKIIKTASLTLEVKDIPGAVETLKSIAAQKGGYLSSTNVQKGYNDRLTGSVVIRIPQTEFENALIGVKAIGTVKSISTQGQDVTEEYVDLQAQITSYQNQLAQYNAIMKQSTKIEDIIKVQEQIDLVQTELNRLEGRLKYLNSRIDLSTITVSLQEPEPVGGESGHNFISTINEGIAGFFGMIDAIIIIFLALLPLIILGGIGYGIYRWRKGNKPAVVPAELTEKK